jgi:LssY C-terminus
MTVADEKRSFSEGRPTIRIWLHTRITTYAVAALLLLPPGLSAAEMATAGDRLSIPDGTTVQLQLTQTVSSSRARRGDPLDFVVEKDVSVDGLTVLRKGSHVRGNVIGVKGRRMLGIGGNITVGFDSIQLLNGETVGLSARKVIKGSSHTWRMLTSMAVTGLFYLPAAPVFLLTRGGYSTALKGTEVTAHFDCDASLLSAGLPSADQIADGMSDMMEYLPSRVMDREGHEGDMVNLVFVAQNDELQSAFVRAGWVKTDGWNPVIMAWHLARHGTHDAKLPMARFYMFGRVQDYAYALPEPGAIVSRRHHIRIWKTGHTSAGVPIWAGAATFDDAISFLKRGRFVNHTIDPAVDTERDFVGADLARKNPLLRQYLQSDYPVFEAQTVSGETYHSDSRILMLDLHRGEAVAAVSPTSATPASATGVTDSMSRSVPPTIAEP